MTDARRLVDKLWSYCHVLRDDGVGVTEYTEQLTYLLFLEVAHERAARKPKPQRPASEQTWTKRRWVYDLRTNQHFTLEQNPLRRHHLDDFGRCGWGLLRWT